MRQPGRVFIFAILAKKSWAIPVGIFAGVDGDAWLVTRWDCTMRSPRYIVSPMFLPAPLLSTGLFVYLWLPSTRKMLDRWNASPQ